MWSLIAFAASMSALISSRLRLENFFLLYVLQKAHLFQGQLRVTRISRLPASLGGLMGPCSKLNDLSVTLFISTLPHAKFSFFLQFARECIHDKLY
jgi:hypothetical protein